MLAVEYPNAAAWAAVVDDDDDEMQAVPVILSTRLVQSRFLAPRSCERSRSNNETDVLKRIKRIKRIANAGVADCVEVDFVAELVKFGDVSPQLFIGEVAEA